MSEFELIEFNQELPFGHVWKLVVNDIRDETSNDSIDFDAIIQDSTGDIIGEDLRDKIGVDLTFDSKGNSPYIIQIMIKGNNLISPGIRLEYLHPMDLSEIYPNGDLSESIIESMNMPLQTHCIEAHNEARKFENPNLQPLIFDVQLAQTAQKWCEQIVATNFEIKHNDNRGNNIGENIYSSSGMRSTPKYVVQAWMDEKPNFDWLTLKSKPGTVSGHYTQVVWAKTKYVGCGMVKLRDGREIWVCNYSPAGNYICQPPYGDVDGDESLIDNAI